MHRTLHRLAALTLLLGALAGCRGQPHEEPPIHAIRNMYQQPRYNPQSRSQFFADSRTMRPPVPGTVSREMTVELDVATGRELDGDGWVMEVPEQVVDEHGGMRAMLDRGQERYDIYCSACHGLSGRGDGIVGQRAQSLGAAALKPPTFHDDRLRHIPDGQLYATITNGIRNMPAYGHSIPVEDRWAIVGYVRALQLSQQGQTQAAADTPKPSGENL